VWSTVRILGKPSLILVDATQNTMGFEREFCNRLFAALKRAGLSIRGDSPIQIRSLEEIISVLETTEYNCILFCAHGVGENLNPDQTVAHYWSQLKSKELPEALFAVCSWQSFDSRNGEDILKSREGFAKIAIVPQSELTEREAGLFYLKFFTELNLHASDEISGKMAWFSFAKAKELLKKRRYTGRFGIRC
jgi:hypothetical protein